MRYSKLADIYEQLEGTTKKLEKRDILAEFYKECGEDDLPKIVLLSMGVVILTEEDLGVADELMRRIVAKTYGADDSAVVKKFKELGDLGKVAEYFAGHRSQRTLGRKELTVSHVFENISQLPGITGSGSVDRKINLISELLSHASAKEARYIVRTVLGDMRIGVAHGTVRDAIAKAFGKEPSEVEHSWNVTGDFGKVAQMAKKGKMKSEISLFTPVRVMLADRAPDLKEALETFEHPAVEQKLDGFRAQIHKKGSEVRIFSRRLDEVTKQFPEVVKWAKECLHAKECIVEGEILAVDPKTGSPRPFQQLSRRIQRKYDIDKMVHEIPVRIDLFEVIYYDGESWMDRLLKDRFHLLNKIVKPLKNKFEIIEHIETKDLAKADRFYKNALAIGEEGVIVKNMEAKYQPGRRVGFWKKVKPVMEPLDLVIVGGEWGVGKRTKWVGSLTLAARKGDKFLPTGMMGSGLTEEQMESLTKRLKELVEEEHGKTIKIKPKIVIEVAYEEIQRSPKYPTGYALRFPRLIRLRDEKGPHDANTVSDIEKLFRHQKKIKRK